MLLNCGFSLVTKGQCGGAVEMTVTCHSLCARQGWPLLASWFKCSSISQCLGDEELCIFLVPSKGLTERDSQARHSLELLWILCCGWWRHLEILSHLQRVNSLHVCGNLLQLFSQSQHFSKKMHWGCIYCWPRIACVSRTWLSPHELFTQAFYLYCSLYLCGLYLGRLLCS